MNEDIRRLYMEILTHIPYFIRNSRFQQVNETYCLYLLGLMISEAEK